ncbi:SsgA family sporulation/cell division regulator [Kitasatospora sp. NPDC088160]|uniref:SsgA family sporulation/cell division regulator n=1 Tax=Kitasatospora sp. NPDC088160 TaxID=3364072 RepID=UPI00382C4152
MTIRNDQTPAGLAADEAAPDPVLGFDDLLAASSLGAPHVVAMMAPLPATAGAHITRHLNADICDDSAEGDRRRANSGLAPQRAAEGCPHDGGQRPATSGLPGLTLWTRNHDAPSKPQPLVLSAPNGSGRSAVTALLWALLGQERLRARPRAGVSAHELFDAADLIGANLEPDLATCHVSLERVLARWEDRKERVGTGQPRATKATGHPGSGRTTAALWELVDDLRWTTGGPAAAARSEEPYRTAFQEILEQCAAAPAMVGRDQILHAIMSLPPLRTWIPTSAGTGGHEGTYAILRQAPAERADGRPWPHRRPGAYVFDTLHLSAGPAFADDGDWHTATDLDDGQCHRLYHYYGSEDQQHAPLLAVDMASRTRRVGEGLWSFSRLPSGACASFRPPLVVDGSGPGQPAAPFTHGLADQGDLLASTNLALRLNTLLRSPDDVAASAYLLYLGRCSQPPGTAFLPARTPRAGRRQADAPRPEPAAGNRHGLSARDPRARLTTEVSDAGTALRMRVRMHLLTTGEQHIEVPTELVYRSRDPYAVELAFTMSGTPPVHWTLARDLLTDGLTRPAGAGDARIRSDPAGAFTPASDRRVHLSLDPPQGQAHLTMPWSDLEAFVTATRKIVAPGREHTQVAAALEDFTASIHLSTTHR